MCKKSSELLDVFCLLSEPLDIRNWFSSYEYESPASDTLNDFGCSSFKGSQCEKEELDTEESNRVKDENLGEFRNTELIDELASGEKTGPNAFVECKRDDKLENPYVNEVLSLIFSCSYMFLLLFIFDFHKNSEHSDLGFMFVA